MAMRGKKINSMCKNANFELLLPIVEQPKSSARSLTLITTQQPAAIAPTTGKSSKLICPLSLVKTKKRRDQDAISQLTG